MFYRSDEACPLTINPLKALVSPRPIGWISSVSASGVDNLAPYSFFNLVSVEPPMVVFSSSGVKDSLTNVLETGEFTCNILGQELEQAMIRTSDAVASDVDEFAMVGLEKTEGITIRVPRVAKAPAALECKLYQTLALPRSQGAAMASTLVIGTITGVYIDETIIRNGRVDVLTYKPVARLGYLDYAHVETLLRRET